MAGAIQQRYRKVRKEVRREVKVECPTPQTVGCESYVCSLSNDACETDCINEPLICVLCSQNKTCNIPLKKYILGMHRLNEAKEKLLEKHDKIQNDILEIQKYFSALKWRQKWTANDRLKDLGGQLKGLRYCLYKLDVPFKVEVRLGMKIEEQMIRFWQTQDGKE